MSFAKIALFAFGLATVLVAGGVGADAANYRNRSVDWSNAYNSTVIPGPTVRSPEDLLFERSKGGFN
ncbi:MAG: hypothetical protein ACXW3M_08180 [Rhodoplanes sp.]